MFKRSLCFYLALPCLLSAEIPYLFAQSLASIFYSQFDFFQIHSRPLFARGGELRENFLENGIWINEEFGFFQHREREYVARIDTPYNYLSLGSDTSFVFPQATLYFGGELGVISAVSRSRSFDEKRESYVLGAYFSYIQQNRFFVDLNAKYFYKRQTVFFREDFFRNFLYGDGNLGLYLGVSIGHRFSPLSTLTSNFFFLEPSIMMETGYLSTQGFALADKVKGKMKGFFPFGVKTSLAFGREWNSRYKGSLKGGVALEYDRQINGAISLEDGINPLLYLKGEDDFRVGIFVEADFILNQNLRFFMRSNSTLSGKINVIYAMNLGVRLSFGPLNTHGLHYKKSIDWMDETLQ